MNSGVPISMMSLWSLLSRSVNFKLGEACGSDDLELLETQDLRYAHLLFFNVEKFFGPAFAPFVSDSFDTCKVHI